jgi:hypothetical protein
MQQTPLPKGQKPLAVSDGLYDGVKLTPLVNASGFGSTL